MIGKGNPISACRYAAGLLLKYRHLPSGVTWQFTEGQRLTDCPGAHVRQYVVPELRIR
jgi:hypothetical protein